MEIIKSLEPVLEQSIHVHINLDKVRDFAANFGGKKCEHWTQYSPLASMHLDHHQKAAFLFVFNAISFSYWGNQKWTIENDGHTYSRGTWSMIAAIQRAIREDISILDSAYLANIGVAELGYILRGNVEIPLLKERAAILQEVGSIVAQKYSGDFFQVITKSKRDSAPELVDRIVGEFNSFDDSAQYAGENVYFHKRAQLLVSDLNYSLRLGLRDTHRLTACADYILPLVLRHYGILGYGPNPAFKIDHGVEIPKNSEEEIEIRAGTIMAVENIKNTLQQPHLTSMQLNDYLWIAGDTIPQKEFYHLTRTTAY